MKNSILLSFVLLFLKLPISNCQVNAYQLDQIASHLLTVNNIQLRGSIVVNAYQASGYAATIGNSNYSIIYIDELGVQI